jgi:hypothetical protein
MTKWRETLVVIFFAGLILWVMTAESIAHRKQALLEECQRRHAQRPDVMEYCEAYAQVMVHERLP